MGDAPETEVRIQSGSVDLVEGPTGQITVTVETNDPRFVIQQRGDLIEVSSDRDARWMFSSSAKVVVALPPHATAVVRTASADIDVQVPVRKAEIKTASGNVAVREADFAVIKTASGSMELGRIGDALRSATASGDLSVKEAHGSVVTSTASGDVRIADTDATLEVNTVSGKVMVDRYDGPRASFKSMSGNVHVGIPEGTKLDLDADLLSGKVNLPPKSQVKPETKREMTLKVKSVSGDLSISRVTG